MVILPDFSSYLVGISGEEIDKIYKKIIFLFECVDKT